jgi:hypothetical protein
MPIEGLISTHLRRGLSNCFFRVLFFYVCVVCISRSHRGFYKTVIDIPIYLKLFTIFGMFGELRIEVGEIGRDCIYTKSITTTFAW